MKKPIIIAVVLVVVAAGLWLARPAYRSWKQQRFVATAQKALESDDLKAATLSAKQALAVNPSNMAACRVMAAVCERMRAPAAIQWRRKLADLEPLSVSNKLDLARCAITFGDMTVAAQALQRIAPTNRNTSVFHQLAAMVAAGSGQLPVAEAHFARAEQLDPTNSVVRFNLAVIRLQATGTSVVASAVQSLESLRDDPAHGHDALRHLVMAATMAKDHERSVELSAELVADPESNLNDRLLRLGVLHDADDPGFAACLQGLQSEGQTNGTTVNVLATWLIGRNMADEAARWLDSLPDSIKSEPAVTLVRADAYMAQSAWPEMQASLSGQKWGDVDFLRLAMLSRSCREQNQDLAAQGEWLSAVQLASGNPRSMAALASIAGRWGWAKEQEELLWSIVSKFPSERWALQTLDQIYTRSGNTRGMQRIYSTLVAYNPEDLIAKNNLAAVSLLLNLQPARSYELANEAYTRHPSNASFASTMAYALYSQGRTDDGIAVLEKLKPAQLEHPSVALYYGLLLLEVETPDKKKARKYLDIAADGKLLPEEESLLKEARRKL